MTPSKKEIDHPTSSSSLSTSPTMTFSVVSTGNWSSWVVHKIVNLNTYDFFNGDCQTVSSKTGFIPNPQPWTPKLQKNLNTQTPHCREAPGAVCVLCVSKHQNSQNLNTKTPACRLSTDLHVEHRRPKAGDAFTEIRTILIHLLDECSLDETAFGWKCQIGWKRLRWRKSHSNIEADDEFGLSI